MSPTDVDDDSTLLFSCQDYEVLMRGSLEVVVLACPCWWLPVRCHFQRRCQQGPGLVPVDVLLLAVDQ